jgi:hypothetical protein
MSAEQAQAHLAKLQKKVRDRQRAYVKRQAQEGKKRIHTFITAKAGELLDDETARTRRPIGDIISDALVLMLERPKAAPVSRPSSPSTTVRSRSIAPHPDYDEAAAVKRIGELTGQGMNGPDIARQLGREGFITQKGLPHWSKAVVYRWIRKIRAGK